MKWIDEGFTCCMIKKKKHIPSCNIKKGHAFSFISDTLTSRKNKTELNVTKQKNVEFD
ncbi:hypothetical protein [Bacillus thuringiensis]|uniref:hypothetical protein n=1 Tax=Bacillus cereus group TaxID=86661 RepID=UPI0018906E88|nr:hypothetical protein [Bacillus thuringiensis]MCU5031406.1 hypothetical protein [Bacillus cereus]HDR4440077.1 hypothetical protein [Bacillus cereus]